jgi:hypothetical protein
MPRVLPSQVIPAIDSLFGANRNELDGRVITNLYRAEVQTLLALLDEVPGELIDLPAAEYLEFTRCRAVLATTLVRWNAGDVAPARDVGGKDAVERIRRLMKKCRDELPPPAPELPFIADPDVRLGIEDRIHAAWTDFNAREWMGATVFAGAALEALLLWALKQVKQVVEAPKRPLDDLQLAELIRFAVKNGVIDQASEQQASLARDARNLVHPGKALRSGEACNKTTALTALAAVYRVIDELAKLRP